MRRSFSMLMGRVVGGENTNTEAKNEFSRPVRSSIRAPNRRVDRHGSTRLAITNFGDERNFRTDRMNNVKVNVLISEVSHYQLHSNLTHPNYCFFLLL